MFVHWGAIWQGPLAIFDPTEQGRLPHWRCGPGLEDPRIAHSKQLHINGPTRSSAADGSKAGANLSL